MAGAAWVLALALAGGLTPTRDSRAALLNSLLGSGGGYGAGVAGLLGSTGGGLAGGLLGSGGVVGGGVGVNGLLGTVGGLVGGLLGGSGGGLVPDVLGTATGLISINDPYNPGLLANLLQLPEVLLNTALGNATFYASDQPGSWFDTRNEVLHPLLHTRSLAVALAPLGAEVKAVIEAPETHSRHTFTSLFWPTGAPGMPFEQETAYTGTESVYLSKPGLYAFVCKMHPFMLAAVLVDDPLTVGLDLGQTVTLYSGKTIPTASDLMWRTLRAFFVITNPAENWQVFKPNAPTTWDPHYPAVPILAYDGNLQAVLAVDFNAFMRQYFHQPTTNPPVFDPMTPGVGEVWIDLQYEKTAHKTKPGTVTAIDANTWSVFRKFAGPSIEMNNPHNNWTDFGQNLIYVTQWFDQYLTVFDRKTGTLLRNIEVGDGPSHVMTRPDTDQVHVPANGDGFVVELSPGATAIDRIIQVQPPGTRKTLPHAHWMSHDGQLMVTPNSNTNDSTMIDVPVGSIVRKTPTGTLPIASSMSGDKTKYYVANFLAHSISCISVAAPACHDGGTKVMQKTINLTANYDAISGNISGPIGMLPIQTPVGPTGKYVLTANTLTNTITVIDTDTDTLVKSLPCDAGCHGINFGAKMGGGYYAYVTSKFANTLIVVDPDPNNDGEPDDATIVGRVLTDSTPGTLQDDTPTLYSGMGGQGVLPIPLVYNGWVQKLPDEWKAKLTPAQMNPIP